VINHSRIDKYVFKQLKNLLIGVLIGFGIVLAVDQWADRKIEKNRKNKAKYYKRADESKKWLTENSSSFLTNGTMDAADIILPLNIAMFSPDSKKCEAYANW